MAALICIGIQFQGDGREEYIIVNLTLFPAAFSTATLYLFVNRSVRSPLRSGGSEVNILFEFISYLYHCC